MRSSFSKVTALLHDLRLAFRQLSRRPAFALTAVLTLAIGMGVNALAFGVVNGLLFNGFATHAIEGLGRVATTPGGEEEGNASLQEYHRFAEATRGTLAVAAEGRLTMAWRHDGRTDPAWVLMVSTNYFSMVTPEVIAGQLRVESVPGGSPSVVIGERFWRDRLGSATLAGLTLRLNDVDVGVAGVIAESFTGPSGLYSPDVWMPLDEVALFRTSPALQKRDTRWLFLLGRLEDGATSIEAQGHVDAAAALMARDWPDTHTGRGARFRNFAEGNSERRGLATAAAIGMGIIGLILLLACFNVANLLLAHAVEREREMGIRTALGAGAGRLMRIVITEGFVLAAVSGALALLLAWWTESLVGAFAIPIDEPQHIDLRPDARVVWFIIARVFIAGVLPGLWPALAAARVDVVRVLGSQGTGLTSSRPSPLRKWLVGAQVAGSTAFLAMALLFVQSYSGLSAVNPGFDREHLVVAELEPASQGYTADGAERYIEALTDRLRALPGLRDLAVADRAPFFIGFDRELALWHADRTCEADACPSYPVYAVGAGYFRTLGIALAGGREFEGRTTTGEVILNQALARQLFPEGGGIGQTLRMNPQSTLVTVVGITTRTHMRGLDRETPAFFVPLGPRTFEGALTIVARASSPPALLVRPIVEAAEALDPAVALRSVKTMSQRMEVQLWPFRTLSWMFSICAGLAVVLATVGLAGVLIHALSRRAREFGVRLSVGASPRHLVIDVLRSSTTLLVPGLIVGLMLAAGTARLAQAVLVGVNVLNPLVYLAVALVQSVVVLAACFGPALRASRVDPLVALRSE